MQGISHFGSCYVKPAAFLPHQFLNWDQWALNSLQDTQNESQLEANLEQKRMCKAAWRCHPWPCTWDAMHLFIGAWKYPRQDALCYGGSVSATLPFISFLRGQYFALYIIFTSTIWSFCLSENINQSLNISYFPDGQMMSSYSELPVGDSKLLGLTFTASLFSDLYSCCCFFSWPINTAQAQHSSGHWAFGPGALRALTKQAMGSF